jgi:hypothetical protein
MLRVRDNTPDAPVDKMQDFEKLSRFMLGWVLQPVDEAATKIMPSDIRKKRLLLDDDQPWVELIGLLNDANPCALVRQFKVSLTSIVPTLDADFAALPWWPGVRWHFRADLNGNTNHPSAEITAQSLIWKDNTYNGDVCMLVDYLRAVTGSLLSESERLISTSVDAANKPTGLTWNELWNKVTTAN